MLFQETHDNVRHHPCRPQETSRPWGLRWRWGQRSGSSRCSHRTRLLWKGRESTPAAAPGAPTAVCYSPRPPPCPPRCPPPRLPPQTAGSPSRRLCLASSGSGLFPGCSSWSGGCPTSGEEEGIAGQDLRGSGEVGNTRWAKGKATLKSYWWFNIMMFQSWLTKSYKYKCLCLTSELVVCVP